MSLPPSRNTVTKPKYICPPIPGRRKKEGLLFGPFIGSLEWELYRFAPYAIYLKKQTPNFKLVVLTRLDRFDLYGQYADILIPLRIKNDEELKHNCFTIDGFSLDDYKKIVRGLQRSYGKKYIFKKHFYPDIKGFRYKLRWQFPRNQMDYDFKPRQNNINLVNEIFPDSTVLVDLSWLEDNNRKSEIIKNLSEYKFVCYEDFKKKITPYLSDKISILGCSIMLLKRSKLVIGHLNSVISHLSILLGTPLVSISDYLLKDSVGLLNPLKTKVIQCDNILEGLKECESILT